MIIGFEFEQPKFIYVASHIQGFIAVQTTSLLYSVHGHSAYPGAYLLVKVKYENNKWIPDGMPSIWDKKGWEDNQSLDGPEPWRYWKLTIEEVETSLNEGYTIDYIRGFSNKNLEKWVAHSNDGKVVSKYEYADYYERCDGWRIRKAGNGWIPNHRFCMAHTEILKDSPAHFDPLMLICDTAKEAMDMVDKYRPWD